MVLVEEEQLAGLIRRLLSSKSLQKHIVGVLVLPGSPAALSPADTFPLAEHAPYGKLSYVWNPAGLGISTLDIGTPIFLLDEATVAAARGHATLNAQKVCLLAHHASAESCTYALIYFAMAHMACWRYAW